MLHHMSTTACGYMVKNCLDNGRMNDLSFILRRARKNAGLTMEQVAQHFGISRSAVSQWESPEKSARPDMSKLPALAELYGVDLGELLNQPRLLHARSVSPRSLPSSETTPVASYHPDDGAPPGFLPLPAVSLEVGAGHRLTESQEPETKARLYSLESLQRQHLRASDLVAFRVRGNSMEPYLFDGDWVVIDRSRKAPPSVAKPLDCRHNTYVFRYEDGIMVKMLQALPDGAYNVISLNTAEHKEFTIPAAAEDRLEIYGKVVDRSGWSV